MANQEVLATHGLVDYHEMLATLEVLAAHEVLATQVVVATIAILQLWCPRPVPLPGRLPLQTTRVLRFHTCSVSRP